MFGGTERYGIIGQLGRGGMGVVYEAVDRHTSERVALKVLRRMDAQGIYRFKQEFRALQGIEHPNLVRLGELVEHEGVWFFTMELVPGTDLVTHVSGAPTDDTMEMRRTGSHGLSTPTVDEHDALRSSLRQLAAGLATLHAHGKVHRDVKPSNVRVTPDGRVVLLDFGLIASVQPSEQSTEHHVVGTALYMAPEQAASRPPGPAADWYAFGVVLYQLLCGELPFSGPALQVFMAKQTEDPPPLRKWRTNVPPDLERLCAALLRYEPAERPSAREVLETLGADPATLDPSATRTRTQSPPFIGRAGELARIEAALEAVHAGAARWVHVRGVSGIGKSAFIQRVRTELLAPREGAVVSLSGRCHDLETVPFRGFDGVIDDLSHYLRRLPSAVVEAAMPRDAALLAKAFPVLGRVDAIATARVPKHAVVEPREQRRRIFFALRSLLLRLTQDRPIVALIEDLQWAEVDTKELLVELTRSTPAPSLLLLTTGRADLDLPAGCPVETLELGPLPHSEAEALARALMQAHQLPGPQRAAHIAREAEGHPLYIDELIRYLVVTQRGSERPRLTEAIRARIELLAPETRRVLELAALARSTLPSVVLRAAADLTPQDAQRHISILRAASFVRRWEGEAGEAIEIFHEKVADAALETVSADTQLALHRQLARAFEHESSTPDRALAHLRGAGEARNASKLATSLAHRAAAALAFDQAVRLYRWALADPEDDAARQRLLVALGDALANAGRGREAAETYLEAREGASAAAKIDLERRAATQFLHAGHIDEGLLSLRQVLATVGISYPATERRALSSLLWHRSKLFFRGTRFEAREPSQISASRLAETDTYWAVARGLSLVDPLRGADFQARHLLDALDVGEPSRIARALSVEACHRISVGGRSASQAKRLIEAAAELCVRLDDPYASAWVAAARILEAFLGHSNFERGLAQAAHAEELLRERCQGVTWEIDNVVIFTVWQLWYTGRLRAMSERVRAHSRDCIERGDLYGFIATQSGLHASMVWLSSDDVEGARQQAAFIRSEWTSERITLQTYYQFLGEAMLELYDGRPEAILEVFPKIHGELRRAHVLRVESVRNELLDHHARLLTAHGRKTGDRGLLLKARAEASRLLGPEVLGFQRAIGTLTYAGAVCALGDQDGALARLASAEAQFDQHKMEMYRRLARRCRGMLEGGTAGKTWVDEFDTWLRAEGMKKPERMAAIFAPGFGDPSA